MRNCRGGFAAVFGIKPWRIPSMQVDEFTDLAEFLERAAAADKAARAAPDGR